MFRTDDSINAQSTIALIEELEQKNPEANTVYVICDNARYYRSKLVKEYLKNSKVQLIFLPSHSPNVNLIERFWKYLKKEVLSPKYYETYEEFKAVCLTFFRRSRRHPKKAASLLTENFHITGEGSSSELYHNLTWSYIDCYRKTDS